MKNKIQKKKKIREFGYVDLFETSCCGLPSYADAHKSFSLVKSLKDVFPDLVGDQLNFKENNPMVDENQTEDASNPEEKTETSEEKSEESEEKSEESEEKSEEKAEESEEKSEDKAASFSPKDMTEMMAKAISEGISKGMAAIQTNPGLIDKSPAEKQKEFMKSVSIGELAAKAFGMDKII